MNANPRLSIVFPVFDEAENLPILVAEIREALSRSDISYEVIAVDDGSRDGSLEVLQRLQKTHPELRILALEENSGQSAALDAGHKASKGELIVFLDADLQNDPADIPLLLRHLEESGADMLAGVRVNRQDSRSKRIQSRIGNGVRNWITGDQITDTGCSLKLARRECIDGIKLFKGMHRFLPTLVRLEGYRVVEMPVNHRPRRFGQSKYGAMNRAFRGLADCFAVRWMGRRTSRYRSREIEPAKPA